LHNIIKIIIVCFVLRILALFSAGIPAPDSAQARWYRMANNLADGKGFVYCEQKYFPFCNETNNKTAISSPVPIIVYSFFIKYFSLHHLSAIYLFQLLLGLLSIYFFYKASLHIIADEKISLFGAFLWGSYFPAISMERYLLGEPIASYLLIIGVYYLLEAYKNKRFWYWIISGIILGLSALSRSPLVYFPFLLAPLYFIYNKWEMRSLFNFIIFIMIYVLTLSPWLIKNYNDFGVIKSGTSMNGYNLYRFNYILKFDDYLERPWQTTIEFKPEFDRFLNENNFTGNENEYEMDRFYFNEGLKQIKKFPLRYIKLSISRFFNMFSDYKIQSNRNILWYIFGFETFIFFLLSIFNFFRRELTIKDYTLYLLVFYFIVGHSLVATLFRYILPVVPFIIMLALGILKDIFDGNNFQKYLSNRFPINIFISN